MKEYLELPAGTAHRLINHGPVVLVATRSADGRYDIAPVAWNCPAGKDPARLLVVVGRAHRTHRNIVETGRFIVCVPHADQVDMVLAAGSVSGADADKYAECEIAAFPGGQVDALVPDGCVGYIECALDATHALEAADIFVGTVLRHAADPAAFDGRLMTETAAGKTLHHNGGAVFSTPADAVIDAGG